MMPRKYEIRNACFACTTPYQVIGAVSIAKSLGKDADLYIFGMFSGYKELAERMKAEHIFKNVIAVDADRFTFMGKTHSALKTKALAFKQMLTASRCVSGFLPGSVAYAHYYSSSRAHVKNLFLYVLEKRNPALKIHIYDDGLGSYLEKSHVLKTSALRKRFETLLGWDLYTPGRIDIQLYLPEIACVPEELKQCPLTKMPRTDWMDAEGRRLLHTVFGTGVAESISQRVILFDNVRGSAARKTLFEGIDACYRIIADTCGRENVILKPHPRSTQAPESDLTLFPCTGIPMEVLYSDMPQLEKRILISYNSTATYSPKILFGAEPWVINLHRLVPSSLQEPSETLYRTFLKTYRRKEKLMAPRTLAELKEQLLIALKEN